MPTSAESVLAVTDLTVAFAGVMAVDHVSLAVGAGQIAGLIGPNGAGKSTVVNAVAGAVSIVDGLIVLGGRSLVGRSVHARARAGLSRTFQTPHLFDGLSCVDNVALARQARTPLLAGLGSALRHRPEPDREHARAILSGLGLSALADEPVQRLSYPDRKLLEFARAIAGDQTRALLLDEPMAGIPGPDRRRVADTIRAYLSDHPDLAVLLIEHDMAVIRQLCSHIHVLDSGRLIAAGSYHEVVDDPQVREAYLGTAAA